MINHWLVNARYITHSKMLLQLKKLVEVTYEYGTICSTRTEKHGRRFQDINFLNTSINRLCTMKYTSNMKEAWNTLLQDNLPPFAPAVLPIIGGIRVVRKPYMCMCAAMRKSNRYSLQSCTWMVKTFMPCLVSSIQTWIDMDCVLTHASIYV
jgi:hypothetical protein